jgi:hypothetical protein
MVQYSSESRELAVKVVYYGPALSGKTTNLQALFHKIDPRVRGRLMTLDTKDDRTLFFDMMPVFFKSKAGVKVKLKLYTVPGQVMHESTRRIVLQGTDAIAFVADSRRAETAATLAYWMNKRDLPDTREVGELADLRQVIEPPIVPAVAIRGEGVVETLYLLLKLCYRSLDRSLSLDAKWRISEREFLERIFSHVDLKGTSIPPPGAPGP